MTRFRTRLAGPAASPGAYDDSPDGLIRQLRPDHDLIVRVLPDGQAARWARALVREVLKDADVPESEIADAELAVGELAANADTHSYGPYEMRLLLAGGYPVWCEVIDADEDITGIPEILAKLRLNPSPASVHVEEPPQESGHGLMIVHRLSGGRCGVFPTVMHTTGLPGKAVAFALPGSGGLAGKALLSGQDGVARLKAHSDRRPAGGEGVVSRDIEPGPVGRAQACIVRVYNYLLGGGGSRLGRRPQ